MTDIPEPSATVAGQSIALHLANYPDIPNRWGPGHIRPTGIRLDYGNQRTPDARLAHVFGVWVREDGEATDATLDRDYYAANGDLSNWPPEIADLAKKHQPHAVAPSEKATVLEEGADALQAYIDRYRSPSIANWTGAVAFLRRLAAETQPEAPWATDGARIGRVLIWSWARVGDTDFGQGYRTAQEDVRAILTRPLLGSEERPEPEPDADLIEDYLRFLRGQGPEPDLSGLTEEQREAITGQFDIVKALADRDAKLPPLDRDPVARRLGLHAPAAEPEVGAQPARHAPGKAILCPDCSAKGNAVCTETTE